MSAETIQASGAGLTGINSLVCSESGCKKKILISWPQNKECRNISRRGEHYSFVLVKKSINLTVD
jgi:hypothetical protein